MLLFRLGDESLSSNDDIRVQPTKPVISEAEVEEAERLRQELLYKSSKGTFFFAFFVCLYLKKKFIIFHIHIFDLEYIVVLKFHIVLLF